MLISDFRTHVTQFERLTMAEPGSLLVRGFREARGSSYTRATVLPALARKGALWSLWITLPTGLAA